MGEDDVTGKASVWGREKRFQYSTLTTELGSRKKDVTVSWTCLPRYA